MEVQERQTNSGFLQPLFKILFRKIGGVSYGKVSSRETKGTQKVNFQRENPRVLAYRVLGRGGDLVLSYHIYIQNLRTFSKKRRDTILVCVRL